jgi:hypothetical protein
MSETRTHEQEWKLKAYAASALGAEKEGKDARTSK